jgi:hypothetical protein
LSLVRVVITLTKEQPLEACRAAHTRLRITAALQAHGAHGRAALVEPLDMLVRVVLGVMVDLQPVLPVAAEVAAVAGAAVALLT